MARPHILVVELGSQYTQVIGRSLRELKYRSAILDPKKAEAWIRKHEVKCVILSGGPHSVTDANAPKPTEAMFALLREHKVPVLGICFGMQWMAHQFGGTVENIETNREFGPAMAALDQNSLLFTGLKDEEEVWASHGDTVSTLPDGFEPIGWQTTSGAVTAMASKDGQFFGVQFHPEVTHTPSGKTILENFVSGIAGCEQDWDPTLMVEEIRRDLSELAQGDAKAIIGFSGGVDSTTLGAIASSVFGERLLAVAVDAGHLREGELDEVKRHARSAGLILRIVDARDKCLKALAWEIDSEKKRKAFTKIYEEAFAEVAAEFGATLFLQGTLAPDVIESGEDGRDLIKSHHNVKAKVEGCQSLHPIASLFKYEVREIAKSLGLPESVWSRQPFPGPGLTLRVVGAMVTEDAMAIVRKADAIVTRVLKQHGEYSKVDQLVVAMLCIKTTGVKGDARSYGFMIAVRGVITSDFMTAEGYDFPTAAKKEISREVTKLKLGPYDIVRVVWDTTDKPSGTTEYE